MFSFLKDFFADLHIIARKTPAEPVATNEGPDIDHDAIRAALIMTAFQTGKTVQAQVHDDGTLNVQIGD